MGKKRLPKKISKIKASSPLSTPELLKKFKNIKWKLVEKILSEFIDNEDTLLKPFKTLVNLHYDEEIKSLKQLLKNLDIYTDESNLTNIIDSISYIIKSFSISIVQSKEYTNLFLELIESIKEIIDKSEEDSYKSILETMYFHKVKEPKKIKFFLTDLENTLRDIKNETFKNYEETIVAYIYDKNLDLINEINNLAKGLVAFAYIESFNHSEPYMQISYVCSDYITSDEPSQLTSIERSNQNFLTNYKDLNSLATNNGYKYDRSRGGHGIFKNENGNIVVIPQGRPIGKGLSLKIQKDILYPKSHAN